MRQLTCEMCGSTDLMKQDGVFVCQSCGCKYSVEEAKKMMVEGTVEVQGTVRIDDSAKYNNVLQLAEDAFIDGRWDSAYSYCNEALTIRPNDPLIIAMQGLSVLGKEKIVSDVPTSSTNSMKRMFAIIDTEKTSAPEKIDILTKISNYLDQVCKAKKAEFEEEIKVFNSQKVAYRSSEETGAAANLALQALGGNIFTQQKAEADLEKAKAKRLHNEALDAQISKVNSRKRAVETFNSSYKQQISSKKTTIQRDYEAREKEKRIAAYWAEHASEKATLESELETVNNRLSILQAQIDAILKEVSPQIAALDKKKKEKIPEEIAVDKQKDLIRELERTRANLGIFKGKEKKAITERLGTVEHPKLDELKKKYEVAKKEHQSSIDAELAMLNAEGKELKEEAAKLKTRQTEINRELTKDPAASNNKGESKSNLPTNAEIINGEKVCPKCGQVQKVDRKVCWSCGQQFSN